MKLLNLLLLYFAIATAYAQVDAPILRLNTPMHTAKIGRISTDAAGKYILTCSNDKTAKLWDANSGKLLRTFRPPIAHGDEGMLYACSLSPDGSLVVVGGWSKSNDIFIFNAHTGEMKHKIGGLASVIHDLEFSPDGRYLAAALGGNNGIRIYKSPSFELIKKDETYGASSFNIAFAKNGQLASVCYDGYVRLYNSNFELIKKQKATGGKEPYSLAFSPDGSLIALGYCDSPKIQVLAAYSLEVLYSPNVSGEDYMLGNVTFSKEGNYLIAGGSYSKEENGKWWRQIRRWEDGGRGSYQDFPAAGSTIMDIKILPDGNIVYCGTQPDWGILDVASGERLIYLEGTINDYSTNNKSHLKINTTGSQIGITPLYKDPLLFDVQNGTLLEKTSNEASYKEELGAIKISNWKNTFEPKLNGKALSFLSKNEMCRSVDIADDAQTIIFGTDWFICSLDAKGKLIWKQSTQGVAWAVNIAPNNKVVVAAISDGTIRWYRLTDGALLLTLYLHPDRKRWVIWTPSGYNDAAPGAEELIGWHVNQGADKEALFYPISKFRAAYYRPDVVREILNTQDEAQALRIANLANKQSSSTRDITKELPPTARILSPTNGTPISSNTLKIAYNLQSPNEEPITGVKIQVNGRSIKQERGLKPVGKRLESTVTIPSEDCTISIIAENRFGSSTPASVDIVWKGNTKMTVEQMRPNLYILAIGVSDYDEDGYDLDFPDDDAQDFVHKMKSQENLLYNKVKTKLLTNKTATKDNILDGLDWIVKETTQHDVAMIFFAGHGRENDHGTFFYLPVGAVEENLRRTSIMKEEIRETVATIPGKVLVFMDACHSGELMLASHRPRGAAPKSGPDITRIINELISAENGAIVFSSSMGRQLSYEDESWENGAFTEALLEGLSGKAEIEGTGKITCKSLDFYISKRVKELTDSKQSPTTNFPPNVEDFPIFILKE